MTGASGGATRRPLLRMPTQLERREPCHSRVLVDTDRPLLQMELTVEDNPISTDVSVRCKNLDFDVDVRDVVN